MESPLQLTWRNVEATEDVETRIRELVDELDALHPRVTSCRVRVEAPHHHHQKGHHYVVSIDVLVPGAEILVHNDPDKRDSHEDLRVAIRDAFAAAKRQLRHHAQVQRGKTKTHAGDRPKY